MTQKRSDPGLELLERGEVLLFDKYFQGSGLVAGHRFEHAHGLALLGLNSVQFLDTDQEHLFLQVPETIDLAARPLMEIFLEFATLQFPTLRRGWTCWRALWLC